MVVERAKELVGWALVGIMLWDSKGCLNRIMSSRSVLACNWMDRVEKSNLTLCPC